MAASTLPPTSSQAARHSAGRTRLPPASSEYLPGGRRVVGGRGGERARGVAGDPRPGTGAAGPLHLQQPGGAATPRRAGFGAGGHSPQRQGSAPHGLVDDLGVLQRHRAVERRVNQLRPLLHVRVEVEAGLLGGHRRLGPRRHLGRAAHRALRGGGAGEAGGWARRSGAGGRRRRAGTAPGGAPGAPGASPRAPGAAGSCCMAAGCACWPPGSCSGERRGRVGATARPPWQCCSCTLAAATSAPAPAGSHRSHGRHSVSALFARCKACRAASGALDMRRDQWAAQKAVGRARRTGPALLPLLLALRATVQSQETWEGAAVERNAPGAAPATGRPWR